MLDPIESLVAVTGIGLLTGERKADIGLDEIERARQLQDKLDSIAKQACAGTGKPRHATSINFDRALKELSKLQEHEQHVTRASKFPAGYSKLAIGYNVFLHQLQPQILQMLPRSAYNTSTGPVVGPPSDLKFWKFLSVLQAIDEPLSIFKAVGLGTITRKQAMAVQTVYPSLSQAFTTSLMQCIAEQPKSWIVPYNLRNGLSRWLGSDTMQPGMLKRLQESHILQQSKQPPQQPNDNGQGKISPSLNAQYGQQLKG